MTTSKTARGFAGRSQSRERPAAGPGPTVLCLAALLGLAGCSAPVGQVAGKVTLKGQPAQGAEIVFTSAGAAGEQYFGVVGDDGAYHVSYRTHRGLPVGRYNVVVTRYTLPNGKPLPPGEEGEALKGDDKALRHAYAFEKDVVAGANHLDFELGEGKKVAAE